MKDEMKIFTGMVEHALQAPDIDQCKSMLWDILHGCTGADNQAEIHERFGTWEDQKDFEKFAEGLIQNQMKVDEKMLNEEATR